MKMNFKLIFTIVILIGGGFTIHAQKNVWPKLVPLVQIISIPTQFDSCFVTLNGYFHYKLEDRVLYIDEKQADYLMIGGVWIEFNDSTMTKFNPKKFDESYVEISGVFYAADKRGEMPYQGVLKNITDIKFLRKYY